MDFSLMHVYEVGLLKQEVFCLSEHNFFFSMEWVRKENVTAQKKFLMALFKEAVRFPGRGVRLKEMRD